LSSARLFGERGYLTQISQRHREIEEDKKVRKAEGKKRYRVLNISTSNFLRGLWALAKRA
jgi:hypothetical protein